MQICRGVLVLTNHTQKKEQGIAQSLRRHKCRKSYIQYQCYNTSFTSFLHVEIYQWKTTTLQLIRPLTNRKGEI